MKFLEILYNKVFVNLIIGRDDTTIYIENCAKNSVIDSYENIFNTQKFSDEMLDYIKLYTKETPFFYISILDASLYQGAIPTCTKNRVSYYHDMSDSEYKCQDKKWIHYTAKTDLYAVEKKYSKIGSDFVFSPFSILSRFFKDKIDGHIALFILMQESSISIGIFQKSQLLYAQYISVEVNTQSDALISIEENEDLLLDEEEIEEGIDLDDIDALDDIESLDDFGDIEDLDSLDDIDEFSKNEDVEEEFYEEAQQQEEEQDTEDITEVNDDYRRFTLIQNSINTFYKDEKYQGDFLENIYVADAMGLSHDFKNYFEEEMYMNVYIRQISLGVEVSKLAKEEVL